MSRYAEPSADSSFDADTLVAICIERGAGALLLDEDRIPPAFFDLGTRVAGELLHGLSKYRLCLAAVVRDLSRHPKTFQDFAREANRGSQFRVFATREAALEWLESRDRG